MNLPMVGCLSKMQPFGYYLGIPKQTEVLLLTLIGICCTIFDASLLDLNSNLHKVWEIALDPTKVSGNTQIYLKYLLSGIILVRTFSVHLYLAFYIVMLWPAIFEERPALLLPWLMVGAIKCLGMGFISFCTGLFTCISYGLYRPACVDFVLAQVIDHMPSFYMWFCVLSYYRELKMCAAVISYESSKSDFESELTVRRRRVRSMADNVVLKHHQMIDEDRHLISVSTIENIVQQITTDLHRKTTRSLDSLLGVMAAEAEKEEIMNLGDDLPSEEVGLTIQEKTAKLLKLTEADIIEARQRRKTSIFTDSMLNIDGNLDKVKPGDKPANILRITDIDLTPPVVRANNNNLRPTKSEKGDIRKPDYSKSNATTTFMRDVSETEIGIVLHYSSTSLATSSIDEENIRSIIEEDILPHIQEQPILLKDSDLSVSKDDKEDISLKEPHAINKNEIPPERQKSDFECQASTLSRSVLRSYTSDLEHYSGNWKSAHAYKRVSPRTALTKPSGNDGSRGSNTKLVENYKNIVEKDHLKEIQEIMPVKATEGPKYASSFKMDGYTMAYNERMMKAKNQKNVKRIVKEIKQQNSTID